ncbi:MAG: DNA polymerase III subunit alpha [Deltaproteobacteria bacterium]|nr:DNA polymerase III subunit alpha [Deltaproteobacteria bacterium]
MLHSRFVHLHLHTQYSLLDGAIRPDELLALAREYKMPAVAMTDHGNLFGAIEFYEKAMACGIKPIIGCEVYVAPRLMTDRTPPSRNNSERAYHLILLVKNIKGYHNLCKLLTKAYLDGFYYKPRVDKKLLKELNEGLIALSACLQGEVSSSLLSGDFEKACATAKEYSEIFPDRRFFLELQNNGLEEQRKAVEGLVRVAGALNLPLVATNDCHYLRREDAKVHDVLLCVQTGKTVNSPDRLRFETDQFYFKSPDEMIKTFKEIPEAIENTIEIAERCNLELKLGEYHLPEFPLPAGETVDSFLDRKAHEGLAKRLEAMGAGEDTEGKRWLYYERLKKELNVIKKMGFSGYFLIVSDFIEYARGRKIPVGPGRGSAAGSLAAYSLGITNLDPIRYYLLFERFLNPDRISLPDIDIDFCFEGRDDVIRYVTEKYGPENVTQIITFGQLKARAVIRDVGRALDIPYSEVDRIAKLVPEQLDITIEKALKEEPRLKKLTEENPRIKELLNVARSLEGLPRHASTHAAGVVISNKPLVDYLPLYKGQKENIITTQYAMKDVEKIGLVKFDFLGIKTLTLIDRAIKGIKENMGVELDIENIPLDDAGTFRLITEGNTNGTFQLESSGIKELLRKLKPETFEDLMAAVALYRPGPLQSGMVDDFIKRKHKAVPISYEVPELKPILETTYGVMVYQEQVMEIAKVLAGFTPGEADVLRKAMGKKVPEVMLDQRARFLDGARAKKVPQKKAEKIFDLMAKFAGYGFNKSHSAAYALIAYETAYLKAHYPVFFMAALLSSNMDDSDKVMKYIGECRNSGIGVLPPDLNESSWDFIVKGNTIRFGLAAIKNVGGAAIESILSARENGPFKSFEDFLMRIDPRKVNKKTIESLVKSGAFDFTSKSRGYLISILEAALEMAQGLIRDKMGGQTSIFDHLSLEGAAPAVIPQGRGEMRDSSEKELLAFEKESLGFYITSHPLAAYERELRVYASDTTETVKDRKTGEEITIAGIVTQRKETLTKKGARMAFLRLEDTSGGIEVIVFSDLYAKSLDAINSGNPVLIAGKVERVSAQTAGRGTQPRGALPRAPIREDGPGPDGVEREECKILAGEIMPLEEAKTKMIKKTHILISTGSVQKGCMERLKEILKEHPGNSPVFLHLVYPDEREVIVGLPDEIKIDPAGSVFERVKEAVNGAEIRLL